jgi:serine/threonine protein phosphatase 1
MLGRLFGLKTVGGSRPFPAFSVPDSTRVYAIGDIHGRADLLADLLARIDHDTQGFSGTVQLVTLGDYINRGPDSRGVLKLLRSVPATWNAVFLRGNHETELLHFFDQPDRYAHWLGWGGLDTCTSYDIAPFGARGTRAAGTLAAELAHAMGESGDLDWLRSTQLRFCLGNYGFVHAGVRPHIPFEAQLEHDLVMIREDWLNRPHGLPLRIVFGHTISPQPLVLPDRIGIDTGAYDSGILTALVLEGAEMRFLQNSKD